MVGTGFYLVIILLLIASVTTFHLWSSDVVFYESFEEHFEGRWIVSEKDDYQGVWKHAKSEGHDDYGLLASQKAKKYAIMRELDKPFTLKGRTVVLQFDTRLMKGLGCGGAYLKYLSPQEGGWKPEEFDNESSYSIMFGPDKCGSTNKVHFILKHKNPKSGKYVAHHLKSPPTIPSDKLSHVYTAILKPGNELVILIDGKLKKRANFLEGEDFEPPIIPAKIIPDRGEKKSKDQVEVPNPDYFELDKPNFERVVAIGIEIWTMQDGILFDNILIATSEKTAETYRKKTWRPKFQVEKEKQEAEEEAASKQLNLPKKILDLAYKIAVISLSEARKKCKIKPNVNLIGGATSFKVEIICDDSVILLWAS